MICTRCDGTGFLNLQQAPSSISERGFEATIAWLGTDEGKASDVVICDCCGNDESWHGIPGEHYSADDPAGINGPYGYNGGLAECQ